MTKAERLIYRESSFVNHAMVLTAVSLDVSKQVSKYSCALAGFTRSLIWLLLTPFIASDDFCE